MSCADAIAAASRTFEADFEADFERSDISALVSNYYADDAVVIGQEIGVFRGHEGARVLSAFKPVRAMLPRSAEPPAQAACRIPSAMAVRRMC